MENSSLAISFCILPVWFFPIRLAVAYTDSVGDILEKDERIPIQRFS
jgi:hypothetical protein